MPGKDMRREPQSVSHEPELRVVLREDRIVGEEGVDVGGSELGDEIAEVQQELPADIALPCSDQVVGQMNPEIALVAWQLRPAAVRWTIGIEESPVPLDQTVRSLLQKIGANHVVETDRADHSFEAEEQRKIMEPAAKLLPGVGTQSPKLCEDANRNVFVLREDRE